MTDNEYIRKQKRVSQKSFAELCADSEISVQAIKHLLHRGRS